MIIEDVFIVDPLEGEYLGTIEFDTIIRKIIKKERAVKAGKTRIIMPAFIDSHIHGIKGIDTLTASNSDFEQFREFLAMEGVCYFLPTTVTTSLERLSSIPLPEDMKLHIEGPFISKKRKGAHNEKHIIEKMPSVDEFERYIDLKKIKIFTTAPENDGFFHHAKEYAKRNVVISLGHSNADFLIAKKAFDEGFSRITHFPNALSSLHHREIGMIGAGLYLEFKLELIVDGIHSSPEFITLVYKIKGPGKIMLVTDSISATGLKDGIYSFGDLTVKVADGKAMLEDGTIAGSTLSFSQAVKNFAHFTKCSLKELAMVTSYNAAVDLGIVGGRIKEGYPAKFVELDDDLNIRKVWNF